MGDRHSSWRWPARIAAGFLMAAAMAAAQDPGADAATAATAAADDRAGAWTEAEQRLRSVFSRIEAFQSIEVAVRDGVVTLEGRVDSHQSREAAVELARRMPGVVYVQDDLEEATAVGRRIGPTMQRLEQILRWILGMLPLLGIALVIVLVFWLVSRGVAAWDWPWRRISRSPLMRAMLRNVAALAVLLVGLLIALELLDATTFVGAVLGTAGVAGIAIGFAFRDIVENYLASLLLSMRQPFAPDDHVVIGDEEGKVVRLTTRETVLMTLEGNHLRIPNAAVFKATILNYTRNPLRRFDLTAGVGNQEDLTRAQHLALEALRATPGVLPDPPPFSRVMALADSNVTIRWFGWIDQRRSDIGKVRSEALRRAKEALDEAGVELPSPIYEIQIDRQQVGEPPPARDSRPKPAGPDEPAHSVEVDDTLERQIEADRRRSKDVDLLVPDPDDDEGAAGDQSGS